MEEDIKKQLNAQDEQLKKIYTSCEKTRKYFMATLIISVVLFVLPLVGLLFTIPKFISTYTSSLGGW